MLNPAVLKKETKLGTRTVKIQMLAFTTMLVAQVACAAALPVAVRGHPATHTIIQPADASPSQIYAAEEFQRFTEEMTGVKLAIATDAGPLPAAAVLLGQSRHTAALLATPATMQELGADGFRIVVKPPYVLIIGGPERGTLYGVYETLERFGGCRWYASWHSVIPQRDCFEIPLIDETQKPAFTLREPFWFDMFNGDFAARNKSNGNRMRLEERHGGKTRFGNGFLPHL